MKKISLMIFFIMLLFNLVSCSSDKELEKKVAEIIKNNPKILTDAIEANPSEIMKSITLAAKIERTKMTQRKQEEEKRRMEEYIDKPMTPTIRKDEAFRGNKNAPITLVEYSDFQCPFCSKSYETVKQLLSKYENKIRFVYKHLPLSFHRNAMLASKYYEAIRLQDENKAFKFHDILFENQEEIKKGNEYLESVAQKMKLDMARLKKDIKSKIVEQRIKEDMKEAGKFGFNGTPGFLVNGVPINGAYPIEYFEKIISKLKTKKKLQI